MPDPIVPESLKTLTKNRLFEATDQLSPFGSAAAVWTPRTATVNPAALSHGRRRAASAILRAEQEPCYAMRGRLAVNGVDPLCVQVSDEQKQREPILWIGRHCLS